MKIQELHLTASNPLFKCWKRAINDSALDWTGPDGVYGYVRDTYGCDTLDYRKTIDGKVRYVDLEFKSQKHLTMFILRWS